MKENTTWYAHIGCHKFPKNAVVHANIVRGKRYSPTRAGQLYIRSRKCPVCDHPCSLRLEIPNAYRPVFSHDPKYRTRLQARAPAAHRFQGLCRCGPRRGIHQLLWLRWEGEHPPPRLRIVGNCTGRIRTDTEQPWLSRLSLQNLPEAERVRPLRWATMSDDTPLPLRGESALIDERGCAHVNRTFLYSLACRAAN